MRVSNADCSSLWNQRLRHSPNCNSRERKTGCSAEALFAAVKSLDNILVQINVAEEISVLVNFHQYEIIGHVLRPERRVRFVEAALRRFAFRP